MAWLNISHPFATLALKFVVIDSLFLIEVEEEVKGSCVIGNKDTTNN